MPSSTSCSWPRREHSHAPQTPRSKAGYRSIAAVSSQVGFHGSLSSWLSALVFQTRIAIRVRSLGAMQPQMPSAMVSCNCEEDGTLCVPLLYLNCSLHCIPRVIRWHLTKLLISSNGQSTSSHVAVFISSLMGKLIFPSKVASTPTLPSKSRGATLVRFTLMETPSPSRFGQSLLPMTIHLSVSYSSQIKVYIEGASDHTRSSTEYFDRKASSSFT